MRSCGVGKGRLLSPNLPGRAQDSGCLFGLDFQHSFKIIHFMSPRAIPGLILGADAAQEASCSHLLWHPALLRLWG